MQLGSAQWAPTRCDLFAHTAYPFLHTIPIDIDFYPFLFLHISHCAHKSYLVWPQAQNVDKWKAVGVAWTAARAFNRSQHQDSNNNNSKSTPAIAVKKSNLQNAQIARAPWEIYSSAVCRAVCLYGWLTVHLPIFYSFWLLSYFTPTSSSFCCAMNAYKFSRIVCPKTLTHTHTHKEWCIKSQ